MFERIKSNRPITVLARRFAIAGDATRLAVVCALLSRRGMCVSDIARMTGNSVATVSHHLRTLARAGLVTPLRDGKRMCYVPSRDPFAADLRRLVCKYVRMARTR